MKKVFIFDMDGVIIDSEPLWREVQITQLQQHNVAITVDDCKRYTMGKRIDDIAATWCDRYHLKVPPEQLASNIMQSMIRLILEKGTAKKGLYDLLDYLKENNYEIAIATSSSLSIANAVLDRLAIRDYFKIVCSADDEKLGKPHPDVYNRVTKRLNVSANECIVLEDSLTGLTSAKAAEMYTIVIPDDRHDKRFEIADKIVASLAEVAQFL